MRKILVLHKLCYLIIGLFIMGHATPVFAAEENIKMEVKAGYNGYARIGQPFPVQILVENNGQEIKARVEIPIRINENKVLYSKNISLPAGSKKRVMMNIPWNDASVINVRLMSRDTNLLETKEQVFVLRPQEMVIGVLAQEESTGKFLSAVQLPGSAQGQRVNVISLDINDIPENGLLLETLDVLIFNNFSTSALTNKQMEALERWIEQGGLLIGAGGADWQKTLKPLGKRFMPVEISNTTSIQAIPGLSGLAGEGFFSPEKLVISKGELLDGEVLAAAEDIPIVVKHSMGKGNIVYLAFDIADEQFTRWAGNNQMWHNIIYRCDPHNIVSAGNVREEMVNRSMNNFPGMFLGDDLPSAGILALILLIYVLLLGPGTYWLLKKADRRDMGWFIIPLLAVLMFSFTYFYAFEIKERNIFKNVVSLVTMETDLNNARAESYMSVFAPTQKEYKVCLTGDKIIDLQSSYMERHLRYRGPGIDNNIPPIATITQGQMKNSISFEDASRWSIRSINYEEYIPKPGNIEAKLYTLNDRVLGTVTNNSGRDLKDCVVFSRYGYDKIGNLAAGEQAEIDYVSRITNNSSRIHRLFSEYPVHRPDQMHTPNPEWIKFRQIIDAMERSGIMQKNNVLFMGQSDQPLDGEVSDYDKGQSEYYTIFITPLEIDYIYDNRISVPPGILSSKIVSVVGQHFHRDSYGINLHDATVEFAFATPFKKGTQLEKAILHIRGDYHDLRTAILEKYNWETAKWEKFRYLPSGIILDDSRYLSDEGIIKVRIGVGQDRHLYMEDVTVSLAGYQDSSEKNGGGL